MNVVSLDTFPIFCKSLRGEEYRTSREKEDGRRRIDGEEEEEGGRREEERRWEQNEPTPIGGYFWKPWC